MTQEFQWEISCHLLVFFLALLKTLLVSYNISINDELCISLQTLGNMIN